MPRPNQSSPEHLERLELLVWAGYYALRRLLPDEVATLLCSAGCRSVEEVYRWRDRVTEQLLALAEPRPGPEMGDSPDTERAYCPACGGSVTSPYQEGFRLPNGLLNHLRGEHNLRECSVVKFFRLREIDLVNDPEYVKLIDRQRPALSEPKSTARIPKKG